MKAKVIRISQVLGDIVPFKGEDTFSLATSLITDWLQKKLRQNITEAQRTEPRFEYESDKGEKAEFLTFNVTPDQKVWTMAFSHPDNTIDSRRWSTEASVAQRPDGTLFFGVRLNLLESNPKNTAPIFSSTPNLLKDLTDHLALVIDGRRIDLNATYIDNQNYQETGQIDDFIAHLESPKRKLPIILVSDDANGRQYVEADNLARKLAGVAHVYAISDESSFTLTDMVGSNLSAYNGAVRFFPPANKKEAPTLFIPNKPDSKHPKALERQLTNSSFFFALQSAAGEKEYPSFAHVKSFYFEHIVNRLKKDTATPETTSADTKQELIDAQNERISALLSEVDDALSMAADQERRNQQLEQRVQQLLKELEDAKEDLHTPAVSQLHKKALFPALTELTPWAQEHFPGELIITSRAQKSADKSVFADPNLIYRGLITLARDFRDAMIPGEQAEQREALRAFQENLSALRLEDRISIRREFAGQYGGEYFASHEGTEFFLGKHLTKGGARDPKRCLRIYYAWDEHKEQVIVGHLPSHLTNQLT